MYLVQNFHLMTKKLVKNILLLTLIQININIFSKYYNLLKFNSIFNT